MQIDAKKDISIECRAEGEPKPRITWINAEGIAYAILSKLSLEFNLFKLGKRIDKEILKISQTNTNKIILTCIADNGIDDVLRKTITVLVSGKISIEIMRLKLQH